MASKKSPSSLERKKLRERRERASVLSRQSSVKADKKQAWWCLKKRGLTYSDLPSSQRKKMKRKNLAAEEIRRRERSGAARYHEDWPRLLRRRFNPQNYYLTPEGLTVFYPMYAIAPPAEGIPTFLLPYGGADGPAAPEAAEP